MITGLSASFFLFLDAPEEPLTASGGTAPSGCDNGVVASFCSAAMPFIVLRLSLAMFYSVVATLRREVMMSNARWLVTMGDGVNLAAECWRRLRTEWALFVYDRRSAFAICFLNMVSNAVLDTLEICMASNAAFHEVRRRRS